MGSVDVCSPMGCTCVSRSRLRMYMYVCVHVLVHCFRPDKPAPADSSSESAESEGMKMAALLLVHLSADGSAAASESVLSSNATPSDPATPPQHNPKNTLTPMTPSAFAHAAMSLSGETKIVGHSNGKKKFFTAAFLPHLGAHVRPYQECQVGKKPYIFMEYPGFLTTKNNPRPWLYDPKTQRVAAGRVRPEDITKVLGQASTFHLKKMENCREFLFQEEVVEASLGSPPMSGRHRHRPAPFAAEWQPPRKRRPHKGVFFLA